MLLGHDLSTVLQCEKQGVTYRDFDNKSSPPEQIVAAHGANLIRIRVWVKPPTGFSDFDSMLEMAQRAKKANLKILLCLHLSDYWADPGQQSIPGAWAGQDFPTLCNTVADYVTHLIEALQGQSTPPFMVAVGNEISNGMLWPTGNRKTNPSQFTTLLKAGLAAVRQKGVATMVHINSGQKKTLVTGFMDLMMKDKVSFDYLGLSFYPSDGALLPDLQVSLNTAAARYNKPMVIAEVADYWTPLPKAPSTQQSILQKLLEVVKDLPNGLGAGVCYWESGWLKPGEAYPGEGNFYWTRALWDDQGMPLPALTCYEPYANRQAKHKEL